MIRANFIDTRRIISNGKYVPVEQEPLSNLCEAIIEQAIDDWKGLNGEDPKVYSPKFSCVTTSELIEFFNSQWFVGLLSAVSDTMRPEFFREMLGIPETTDGRKLQR